jgi:hypothetical protein
MNAPPTTQTLARLEVGLRMDASQLLHLEEELMRTLRRASDLGAEFGSPGDWSTAWRYHWQRVETILQRLRGRVQEMDVAISHHEPDRLTEALTAFEGLKSDDAELMQALAGLREQAAGLNPAAQEEWKALIPVLERHLHWIHSCAQSLLLKLEMLKVHTKEEVDILVRNLVSGQPLRIAEKSGDAAKAPDLVEAEKELGKEHHKFMGWLDVIQGMFLWVENPEERVRKKMSLD